MQAHAFTKGHLGISSVYLPPEQEHPLLKSGLPSQDYHVFFLTGNPGCVECYHDFLTILSHSLLNSPLTCKQRARFYIYGHSLANFVDDAAVGTTAEPGRILSLQEQIHFVVETLRSYVKHYKQVKEDGDGRTDSPCRVILIGHSVGTWMSMEILSRLQSRQIAVQGLHIVGMIALFPTITQLAQSPSGLRFRVSGTYRFSIRGRRATFDSQVETCTTFFPSEIVRRAVQLSQSFPPTPNSANNCKSGD